MKKLILVKNNNGSESVAVLEDDVLVEFMQRNKDEANRGTVVIGMIKDYQPSLEAYFIEVGSEISGYLPEKFVAGRKKTGTLLPLQVLKPATGKKGMTLSSYFTISGEYCVISYDADICRISGKIKNEDECARLFKLAKMYKPENRGIILRTKAFGVSSEDIFTDIAETSEKYNELLVSAGSPGEIIYFPESISDSVMRNFDPVTDTAYFSDKEMFDKYFRKYMVPGKPSQIKYYDRSYDMFDFFSISNKIKEATARRVRLKSGATLIFDYAEAMCVIDVNTAKNTGSANFRQIAIKTNFEAAEEIAVQIRLRNIGGIIIIDFIDMDKENNENLDREFRKFLAKDNMKMTIGGFTALGNYEITRMRKGKRLEFYNE